MKIIAKYIVTQDLLLLEVALFPLVSKLLAVSRPPSSNRIATSVQGGPDFGNGHHLLLSTTPSNIYPDSANTAECIRR